MTKLAFIDLSREYEELQAEWLRAVAGIGARGEFVLGRHVRALEVGVAAEVGALESVAVASGTDALVLALRALKIGPGHEVITTPFSFFAAVEAILRVGATAVFADIEAHSFNIDPDEVGRCIGPRTRAILPVHLFGRPAEMGPILSLARDRGLAVVEDAAQAFGARYHGQGVGAMGDLGCYSFYPTKVLGCYGDGGMVATNHPELAERLRRLRNHGAVEPFFHQEVGYNSRLDEVQAALLRIKLGRLGAAIARRRALAAAYDEGLRDADVVLAAAAEEGVEQVHNVYTVRSRDREGLRRRLAAGQIGSAIYYPHPLHLLPPCRALGYAAGDFPVAERACGEVLSLPLFPSMTDVELEVVCAAIRG